jgi:hypothetical protein
MFEVFSKMGLYLFLKTIGSDRLPTVHSLLHNELVAAAQSVHCV